MNLKEYGLSDKFIANVIRLVVEDTTVGTILEKQKFIEYIGNFKKLEKHIEESYTEDIQELSKALIEMNRNLEELTSANYMYNDMILNMKGKIADSELLDIIMKHCQYKQENLERFSKKLSIKQNEHYSISDYTGKSIKEITKILVEDAIRKAEHIHSLCGDTAINRGEGLNEI